MHYFTPVEAEFLKAHVKGLENQRLTEMFNTHFDLDLGLNQIKAYKKNHKLNSGLTGRYLKGSTPFNKGRKGISYPGMKPTQFKKGNKPHNWVPLGSERITRDGYIQVKIVEGRFQHNWRGKHILIWEEHNGPLPKGHAVIFGDGDNRNFEIDNLILVSRKQLLKLNQFDLIKNDADLTRTGIIIADIHGKISERRK